MTWTKFGAEFRDECAELGLTDAEFRTHVEAIMYLYGIESMDMIIQRRLVRKWAGSDNYADAVRGLVAKGVWVTADLNWRVVHHENVFRQSLTAQRKKRETEKNRQRDKRVGTNTDTNVGTNTDTNVGATQSVSQTDSNQTRADSEQIDQTTGEVLDSHRAHQPQFDDAGWLAGNPDAIRRAGPTAA